MGLGRDSLTLQEMKAVIPTGQDRELVFPMAAQLEIGGPGV